MLEVVESPLHDKGTYPSNKETSKSIGEKGTTRAPTLDTPHTAGTATVRGF